MDIIKKLEQQIAQRQLAIEWEKAKKAGMPFELEYKTKSDAIWDMADRPTWHFDQMDYRRKPTPTYVPWTFEDITPQIANGWFRKKENVVKDFVHAYRFSIYGISLNPSSVFTYSGALQHLEHSTDLKTWHPAGKVSQ